MRTLVLPDRGTLLVNSDIHGNLADLAALEAHFERARREDPETHWVILGDIVHGPDDASRAEEPDLYGYADESPAVVARVSELVARHPRHVHFVLGNHDHGHAGGPHTRKFHDDEVAFLEARLSAAQKAGFDRLLSGALLAVAAPCGLLLTHGSPDDSLRSLEQLDAPDVEGKVLKSLLTSYGQSGDVCARMLANVSRDGLPLHVVVHGHDRDEAGFYREGGNQLCLCIFGAPKTQKRYLRADLGARYRSAADLRDGEEIQRLYGTSRTSST